MLVAGVGRSGTTWLAEALGRTDGATYVHEPDNHIHMLYALRAKRGLHALPWLAAGERAPREYSRLWEAAFAARRSQPGRRVARAERLLEGATSEDRNAVVAPGAGAPARVRLAARLVPRPSTAPAPTPRFVVVKSVHIPLAVEWVARRFGAHVLLVRRDPLNIVASWIEMKFDDLMGDVSRRALDHFARRWDVAPLEASASWTSQVAWRVGFLSAAVDEVAARNPDWLYVSHEEVCADPVAKLRRAAAHLGLTWAQAADAFVRESDRHGVGYSLQRVATDQPERWRERLSEEQVREARAVLERFPLG